MVFLIESSSHTSNASFTDAVKLVQQVLAKQPVRVGLGSQVSVLLCGSSVVSAISTYNASEVYADYTMSGDGESGAGSGSWSSGFSGSSNYSNGGSGTDIIRHESVINNTGPIVTSTQDLLLELGKLTKVDLGQLNVSLAMQAALEVVGQVNMTASNQTQGQESLPGRLGIVSVVESQVTIDAGVLSSVSAIQQFGASLFAVSSNPSTSPATLAAMSSHPASTYAVVVNGSSDLSLSAGLLEQSLVVGQSCTWIVLHHSLPLLPVAVYKSRCY